MSAASDGPALAARLSIRALLGNASRLASGDVVHAVCGIAQGLVLARALGPAGFGQWGLVVALGGMVGGLLSSATSIVLIRHLVQHRANDDRDGLALLLATSILLELALAVSTAVLVAGAGLLHPYAGVPPVVYAVYGLTMLVMFPRKIWAAVCQDRRQYGAMATVNAVGAILRLALVLVVWLTCGLNLLGLAWLFLLSQIIPGLWQWSMIRQALRHYELSLVGLPWGGVWRRRSEMSEMWGFAGQMYLGTSMSTVFTQVDTLILGALRPAEEVGYYRLGKTLFLSLIALGLNVARVAYRDFNDLVAAGRYQELLRACGRLNRTWLLGTLAGMALLAAAAPWLVPTLYGRSFQPAVWPFVLQLIGAAANIGLSWASYLLLSLGQQSLYLRILVFAGFGVIPLMYLGARFGGASGMAVASSTLWVCHSVVSSSAAHRLLRQRAAQEPPTVEPPAVVDLPPDWEDRDA